MSIPVSPELFAEVSPGVQLCYQTFGSPGGDPLVLVMGLGGPMTWWDPELCTMLAEGAAVDWSAVYLSRSFGAAAGVAALAYTAFAFMMMTSRAVGDRLNRRLGAVTLARSGAAVATIASSNERTYRRRSSGSRRSTIG